MVSWKSVRINGTLMKDAAERWYFNGSSEKLMDMSHVLEVVVKNGTVTGLQSTNPTCHAARSMESIVGLERAQEPYVSVQH